MIGALCFFLCHRSTEASVQEVLQWLPAQTTTLIVDNAAGRIGGDVVTGTIDQSVNALGLLGLPETIPKFAYRFCVHGACNNRGAKSLGMLPYDGCDVIAVDNATVERLRTFAAKAPARTGVVQGERVYVVDESKAVTRWTYYFAFDGTLMFCATNKLYLAELLRRRGEARAGSAFPETLAQWKYVDMTTPFWAIRRLTPAMAAEEKMEFGVPGVSGLAVSLSQDHKDLSIVVLGEEAADAERAASWWPAYLRQEKGSAPLSVAKLDDRAWKIVLDAQAPRGEIPLFALLIQLGHVVLI